MPSDSPTSDTYRGPAPNSEPEMQAVRALISSRQAVVAITNHTYSNLILRPITLALRLLMNMVAGHLLLVLFFTATQWFLIEAPGIFKLFAIGTFEVLP